MKARVRRHFAELQKDRLARELVRAAAEEFTGNAADRAMIRKVRREATRLAEEYADLLLSGNLTAADADQIHSRLCSIEVERKVTGVEEDLARIYKALGVIRDYTAKSFWLSYPQAAVDPVILRAYRTSTVKAVGTSLQLDVEPLVREMRRAQDAFGLSHYVQDVVEAHVEWSQPLLLPKQPLTATKVYFMGPLFYAAAGRDWTLTFSTGSGLPDPLEWNGSVWFASQYNVPMSELEARGLKNPFRALNFYAGIINRHWQTRRIYVWQQSKTGSQVRSAYQLAASRGHGCHYVADAVAQLVDVFRTPGLKILALDDFPETLQTWTRVSPNNVMLSNRRGTPEERIGHAVWLGPGFRLSDRAWKSIDHLVRVPLAMWLSHLADSALDCALIPLAIAGVAFLSEGWRKSASRGQAAAVRGLLAEANKAVDAIWTTRNLRGVVKEREAYGSERALAAAAATLGRCLEIDAKTVLEMARAQPVVSTV